MRPDRAVLASTVLWGTAWIPIRQLSGAGWEQGLAITVSCILATIAVVPIVHYKAQWSQLLGSRVWLIGLLMGLGMALYFEAMIRGNVARVVLLFYLMPVWSAILGRIFNGDVITVRRVCGIVLGVCGMGVVFYDGSGFPLPSSVADFLALFSGIAWAFAFTLSSRSSDSTPYLGQVFSSLALMGPAFYLLTLIPGSRESVNVSGLASGIFSAEFWLLALAFIWMLPAVSLTLFGASRLDPGKVAIFLMLEVVISLVSAALLLDEPFGLRESLGAVLIIGASFTEFGGFSRTKEQTT